MQLTQHTDFGLRLLIVLARRGGEPIALPAFASEQGLSYNHVAKVAQGLARAGFVTTLRGRNGGVALARPAAEMTVGEVVRALEPGMRLADCAGCALRFDCATSGYLGEALAAFMAVLDRTSLADAAREVPTAFTLPSPGAGLGERGATAP
ncbi:RrF2 family transcriptional regulator [Novosphingobium tardum]|jgi:Rrf2 family nitric oxide-sensitive transcriptional repressor|uniref:RrF2 family transcriptional regulator n=1 Tax=Novosphingobium tardum TaxID=1538021 RepID=A0ABV8RNL4_9SPHN